MSRFLFGSTGMKLLRNCPCPVWITQPDAELDHLNILVPSDFSDVSLEALRIAVEGGQLIDTRIHVLHALEGPAGPPAWYGLLPKERVEEYITEQRARARRDCTTSWPGRRTARSSTAYRSTSSMVRRKTRS